jgi:molybdopterin synthase catalytic subunit
MFSISEDLIDVERLLANVKGDSADATGFFWGTVRNNNEGYAVSGIIIKHISEWQKTQCLR